MAAIRAHLFAADVEFSCAVYRGCIGLLGRCRGGVVHWFFNFGKGQRCLHIGAQPLNPTFTTNP